MQLKSSYVLYEGGVQARQGDKKPFFRAKKAVIGSLFYLFIISGIIAGAPSIAEGKGVASGTQQSQNQSDLGSLRGRMKALEQYSDPGGVFTPSGAKGMPPAVKPKAQTPTPQKQTPQAVSYNKAYDSILKDVKDPPLKGMLSSAWDEVRTHSISRNNFDSFLASGGKIIFNPGMEKKEGAYMGYASGQHCLVIDPEMIARYYNSGRVEFLVEAFDHEIKHAVDFTRIEKKFPGAKNYFHTFNKASYQRMVSVIEGLQHINNIQVSYERGGKYWKEFKSRYPDTAKTIEESLNAVGCKPGKQIPQPYFRELARKGLISYASDKMVTVQGVRGNLPRAQEYQLVAYANTKGNPKIGSGKIEASFSELFKAAGYTLGFSEKEYELMLLLDANVGKVVERGINIGGKTYKGLNGFKVVNPSQQDVEKMGRIFFSPFTRTVSLAKEASGNMLA